MDEDATRLPAVETVGEAPQLHRQTLGKALLRGPAVQPCTLLGATNRLVMPGQDPAFQGVHLHGLIIDHHLWLWSTAYCNRPNQLLT